MDKISFFAPQTILVSDGTILSEKWRYGGATSLRGGATYTIELQRKFYY